jgi:cobalt-precorrin 5A hydrolase
MGLGETMIVAGVGCRRGTTAVAIMAAIEAALARNGLARDTVGVVATSASKAAEPGIADAAAALGVPLVLVAQADLEAAAPRTVSSSVRVLALTGVPSVAEAAALAAALAAGGSAARLVAPRVAVGNATCALAYAGAAP